MQHAMRSDRCAPPTLLDTQASRLKVPVVCALLQAVQEAGVLRQQVESAERDRAALAAAKARLAAAERQARATEWELEVTQQRLEWVGGLAGWMAGWREETAAGRAHMRGCRELASCRLGLSSQHRHPPQPGCICPPALPCSTPAGRGRARRDAAAV